MTGDSSYFGIASLNTEDNPDQSNVCATIKIFELEDFDNDNEDNGKDDLLYIGTLLHEMVHAFIELHTCYCDRCCNNFSSECGQEGHGETWHAIMTAIANVTSNRFNLDLSFGIKSAMAQEWFQSGADLSEVELQDLDFDEMVDRVNNLGDDSDDENSYDSEETQNYGEYEDSGEDEGSEEDSNQSYPNCEDEDSDESGDGYEPSYDYENDSE